MHNSKLKIKSTHGWDQVKVWIMKVEKLHQKCISKPLENFLKIIIAFWGIWILKSICSLKSPTQVNRTYQNKIPDFKFLILILFHLFEKGQPSGSKQVLSRLVPLHYHELIYILSCMHRSLSHRCRNEAKVLCVESTHTEVLPGKPRSQSTTHVKVNCFTCFIYCQEICLTFAFPLHFFPVIWMKKHPCCP